MYLKSNNWLDSWKEFKKAPLKNKKRILLNEASPAFVHGVNNWINTVTDEGEYSLNEVLPWGDMFDGALRVAVPATSEDDVNLAKIVLALQNAGWEIPQLAGGGDGVRDFTVVTAKQKKRRPGTGEVYEEEMPVAKLDLSFTKKRQIPKGPRAGEWVTKTETTTMSRAINKLTKKDPLRRSSERDDYISPELAEWWQKKQTFYTKGGHWAQIEKLFKDPESVSEMKSDQMIVFSRHPIDVLRMGDVETVGSLGTAGKIGHCHREGGEYASCAQQEALGHGPIAYLVDKKEIDFLLSGADQEERTKNYFGDEGSFGVQDTGEPKHKLSDFDGEEIFNDRDRDIKGIKVSNRLRLRQYRDNEINEMWAIPERQVYPTWDIIPGFLSAVSKWAWDRQKDLYEKAYKSGEFPSFDALERLGGKYGDTRDGRVLNAFFSRSGKSPDYDKHEDVHHEREESEELEPDAEMIAEVWDSRIQDILETMNGRMDHASVYGEVEVMDETPYVMMSAGMTVEFNEDLFGSDGGAEYELPTGYGDQGYNDLTSELIEALREQTHVYADDADINDWQNTISFNFNINNEDYDPNPEGFDSFADYIETEWDNSYEAIRKVIKRHLINEGYMAPDAYEKLRGRHQSAEELADEEGHAGTVYKHWDFDEDGNEITFTLKDPATLVAEPSFHGLYLGAIPISMDLSYIFHDWKYKSSKEFENKFIPKIRTLFADAEEEALKQLNLPGLEAEEMHGLLLPEKAEFRLKQVFDSYEKPAHIYLQVKIEIDEDITDAQTEEIEYFLKYLDEDSKIDILEKAAESTFQEFLQPAIKKRVATDKVKNFGKTIQPLLKQLPIEQLMNFVGGLPLIDRGGFGGGPGTVASVTLEMTSVAIQLAPKPQEGRASISNVEELFQIWTVDTILKAAQLQAPMNLAPLLQDLRQSVGDFQSQEDVEAALEDLYKGVNKVLGIRLQDSNGASRSDWNPGELLERLHQRGSELVVTGANNISYVFDMIMKDPKKAGGVDLLKKIMKPDYAPAWYTEELQKAGIASERIVDILPVSALDNPRTQEHEDATDELMKLLGVREGVSLIDRIDEALR